VPPVPCCPALPSVLMRVGAAGEDGGGLAHEYGFGPVENPAGRVFVQVPAPARPRPPCPPPLGPQRLPTFFDWRG
jgi:hypothetical protein